MTGNLRQFPFRIGWKYSPIMDLRKVSDEEKVNLCRKYTIHIFLFYNNLSYSALTIYCSLPTVLFYCTNLVFQWLWFSADLSGRLQLRSRRYRVLYELPFVMCIVCPLKEDGRMFVWLTVSTKLRVEHYRSSRVIFLSFLSPVCDSSGAWHVKEVLIWVFFCNGYVRSVSYY